MGIDIKTAICIVGITVSVVVGTLLCGAGLSLLFPYKGATTPFVSVDDPGLVDKKLRIVRRPMPVTSSDGLYVYPDNFIDEIDRLGTRQEVYVFNGNTAVLMPPVPTTVTNTTPAVQAKP